MNLLETPLYAGEPPPRTASTGWLHVSLFLVLVDLALHWGGVW